MIYLDAAATTPVRREVLEAMWPHLTGDFGNPSSHHGVGESAARALAAARAGVAGVLGCRPAEVVFTSGGTEADNLAVKGIALAAVSGRAVAGAGAVAGARAPDAVSGGRPPRDRHVVISAVEHPAVVESAEYLQRVHGFEVTTVPVDSDGLVVPAEFAAALRPTTALAAVMYANNEVGTVQPIAELAALAREQGVPFHTDAVQAAGWLDLRLDALGVDSLGLSGHKLGAPKGVGALAVRQRVRVEPLVHGGGQERGRRSGTENVAFAVGLAAALTLAEAERAEAAARTTALRDRFIEAVLARVPDARLTGHPTSRLPSVASFTFGATSGEAVLLQLEERGVIVSSGSACAAGDDDPSPVLLAMGVDPVEAQTAVRFTLASSTTAADLDTAADALVASVSALRALR
ncbi:cysteine desulfurase [Herbiconiux moechotypicola]|uniref:Cysteine desulfurase family protein n=1 Tax=Herbiconiux moechotypicola TaxID=637393 RepID=A0ABN3D9I8_9MICO|nr:cysteine desulfurase family protein [Herbiconiux moechotypicola]MCS5729090.1 cysteine desulfurase [Herbiconiux moechotypicola]